MFLSVMFVVSYFLVILSSIHLLKRSNNEFKFYHILVMVLPFLILRIQDKMTQFSSNGVIFTISIFAVLFNLLVFFKKYIDNAHDEVENVAFIKILSIKHKYASRHFKDIK